MLHMLSLYGQKVVASPHLSEHWYLTAYKTSITINNVHSYGELCQHDICFLSFYIRQKCKARFGMVYTHTGHTRIYHARV